MKCYIFFLPLCIYYCYQILCFSMSNYLNAYKFVFILTVFTDTSPYRDLI